MQLLKHYWVRDGKYLTEIGENGPLQEHPKIQGLDTKFWLTDERGVDYCLSTVPDHVLITEVTPGLEILSRQEWDAIIATIPAPEPQLEVPGAPDWITFKSKALESTELNLILGEVLKIAPAVGITFPAAFFQLENGKYEDFILIWNTILTLVEVSPKFIQSVNMLAVSCNLPKEFVDIFSTT